MSLQWTLIASFLYIEIAIVLLLILPIASPQRWQKIFKSSLLRRMASQAQFYFVILFGILVLCLLDAIREMRKYSSLEQETQGHQHLDAEMQGNMRLFRAQRNFYISGFALFLSLVIRRLTALMSQQAILLAESEAAVKQAKSATSTAQSLLAQSNSSKAQNDTNEAHDREITELKTQLLETEEILAFLKKDKAELKEKVLKLVKDLEVAEKDKEAMKNQANSLAKEYDRLAEQQLKLEGKYEGKDLKKDA